MSDPMGGRSEGSDATPQRAPARWYHIQGEERFGPLDLDTMRRLVLDGVVGPDTWVWADGMPDWLAARQVPALVPPDDLRPERWG